MMLPHEKLVDVRYRARDLVRSLRAADSFGKPDAVGRFFVDGKSYYTDFRPTARWPGSFQEGVPVVYLPSRRLFFHFPMNVIHYGLGSLDLFFERPGEDRLRAVRAVATWLLKHCNEHGFFDNRFSQINTSRRVAYHTNNSAMTQGQALSFLLRVLDNDLLPEQRKELESLVQRVGTNFQLPVQQGGTTLTIGDRTYLCEYCRSDDYVVLNGWIFAVLGLWDYAARFPDSGARRLLDATLATLEQELPGYVISGNNWSYYDNQRRASSPTYHGTHISQLEVLYRLTKRPIYENIRLRFLEGDRNRAHFRYRSRKVLEKILESHRYVTDRP